jgi:hypothetical protein
VFYLSAATFYLCSFLPGIKYITAQASTASINFLLKSKLLELNMLLCFKAIRRGEAINPLPAA